LPECAAQKHLEQIAPQFRKEILDGGTFTKMVTIVAIELRLFTNTKLNFSLVAQYCKYCSNVD